MFILRNKKQMKLKFWKLDITAFFQPKIYNFITQQSIY